jgi:hypothetical protein
MEIVDAFRDRFYGGDSDEAEGKIRDESEQDSGMNPNTIANSASA